VRHHEEWIFAPFSFSRIDNFDYVRMVEGFGNLDLFFESLPPECCVNSEAYPEHHPESTARRAAQSAAVVFLNR
jgi:hypothetical protein